MTRAIIQPLHLTQSTAPTRSKAGKEATMTIMFEDGTVLSTNNFSEAEQIEALAAKLKAWAETPEEASNWPGASLDGADERYFQQIAMRILREGWRKDPWMLP